MSAVHLPRVDNRVLRRCFVDALYGPTSLLPRVTLCVRHCFFLCQTCAVPQLCLPDTLPSTVDGSCVPCKTSSGIELTVPGVLVTTLLGVVVITAVVLTVLQRLGLFHPRDDTGRAISAWRWLIHKLVTAKHRLTLRRVRPADPSAARAVSNFALTKKVDRDGVSSSGDYSATNSFATRLKTLTSFFQLSSTLIGQYGVEFPAAVRAVSSVFKVFLVSVFTFLDPRCSTSRFDQFHKLVAVTAVPIALIAASMCVTALLAHGPGTWVHARLLPRWFTSGDHGEHRRQQWSLAAFHFAIFVSYLCLPSASSAIAHSYHCEWFDDGSGYLAADFSIDCHSGRYRAMVLYATCMVFLFPVGIPVWYLGLLAWHRDAIFPRNFGRIVDVFQPQFGEREHGHDAHPHNDNPHDSKQHDGKQHDGSQHDGKQHDGKQHDGKHGSAPTRRGPHGDVVSVWTASEATAARTSASPAVDHGDVDGAASPVELGASPHPLLAGSSFRRPRGREAAYCGCCRRRKHVGGAATSGHHQHDGDVTPVDHRVHVHVDTTLIPDVFAGEFESHVRRCAYKILYQRHCDSSFGTGVEGFLRYWCSRPRPGRPAVFHPTEQDFERLVVPAAAAAAVDGGAVSGGLPAHPGTTSASLVPPAPVGEASTPQSGHHATAATAREHQRAGSAAVFSGALPKPSMDFCVLTVSAGEADRVRRYAAQWDALAANYDETWDFKRRDEEDFEHRTHHLRFLFEVSEGTWLGEARVMPKQRLEYACEHSQRQ